MWCAQLAICTRRIRHRHHRPACSWCVRNSDVYSWSSSRFATKQLLRSTLQRTTHGRMVVRHAGNYIAREDANLTAHYHLHARQYDCVTRPLHYALGIGSNPSQKLITPFWLFNETGQLNSWYLIQLTLYFSVVIYQYCIRLCTGPSNAFQPNMCYLQTRNVVTPSYPSLQVKCMKFTSYFKTDVV